MSIFDTPFRMADIRRMAAEAGLVRGRGTLNGQPYWTRPGSSVIITVADVLRIAGY